MNTLMKEMATETIDTEETNSTAGEARKKAQSPWNWVQISGRIATDLERKTIKEQTVLSFSLLFETLRKTDRDGSHANFIQVELWGKIAEHFFPLLSKGLELLVSGELFQQRWVASDGKKAQRYLISAQSVVISDQKFRPT